MSYFINDEKQELKVGKVITHVIGGLIFLVILFGSWGNIGKGERGVKFSKITGNVSTLGQGLYFKLPIFEYVTKMDVQVQKDEVVASAASKDLQTVTARVAVNFKLDPEYVAQLSQDVGSQYKERLIDPAVQEVVKAVTAKYTAEELITKREEVREGIKIGLTEKLKTHHILVDQFNIVDFDFSASFNAAIEAKVTAEQNALASKNKLEQVKYEAEQRVTEAKAEAEAIRIQAQAITQQGGAEYVNLKAVEKWNGVLPQYQLSNTTPFLNIK